MLAYEIKDGGSEFVGAANVLDCWVDNGRPQSQTKPPPLSLRLALSVMALESTLIAVAAGNVANGVALTDTDRTPDGGNQPIPSYCRLQYATAKR